MNSSAARSMAPFSAIAVLLLFIACTPSAFCEDYPSRPIRLILPFSPGGPADLVARPYGQQLGAGLGVPVIIDSRGGAGGIIGADAVAKSAADGYTMLLASFSFALQPIQYQNLPYDPSRDFDAVSFLAKAPLILVINPSVSAKSLNELIALAKARPGELNYSITGLASSGNLAMLTLQAMSATRFTPVNSKGASLGALALISGEVQLSFFSIPVAVPYIKSGKLRAIGVTSTKRNDALADVPTIAESGLPGYEETAWYGIFLPRHTPLPIVSKLNAETARAVHSAQTYKAYSPLGLDPVSSSAEELSLHVARELQKWSKVLKDIKLD